MGDKVNTDKVHPDAKLILYNSAFWGSPVIGAIINNGIVSFQQANFSRSGTQGVDVRGGKAHVLYFLFQLKKWRRQLSKMKGTPDWERRVNR